MTTETEKELSNVVAFPERKEDLRDELAMRREEGGKIYCHHDSVWVDEKERTLRCRRCDALVDLSTISCTSVIPKTDMSRM